MKSRVRKAPFRIQGAGLADVLVLSALHERCFEDFWSPHSMQEVLNSPGVRAWLAVVQDGRAREDIPAGFAIARVVTDEAELLSIGVVSEFRRSGLALALLSDVIRHASASGARRLFLEVAEDNRTAQALYASQGFTMVGRRPDYYRMRDGKGVAALTLRRYLSGSRWRWGNP